MSSNIKIFISTDTSLSGAKVYHYYHLRFQIEFIYRDGNRSGEPPAFGFDTLSIHSIGKVELSSQRRTANE